MFDPPIDYSESVSGGVINTIHRPARAPHARKSKFNKNKIPTGSDPFVVEPLDSVESEMRVVRSTTKLKIEPWRNARDIEKHRKKQCGGRDNGCPACVLYQQLDLARVRCATGINLVSREFWRQDGDSLDKFIRENPDKNPKGKEWIFPEFNGYQLIREACPELNSGIASALAQKARKKWAQIRYDTLVRNNCAPSHFKSSIPIPLRAADYKISENGQVYRLSFNLTSGRHPGGREWHVVINTYDDHEREILGKIVSGEWKIGEASLVQDRKKRGRWFVRIAYSRLVKRVSPVDMIGAVNTGISSFLTAVTSDGDEFVYNGDDIEAYLKQIRRRRIAYQRSFRASNRHGHGRARALKPIKVLEGKGERWRETLCQRVARKYAEWFRAKGVWAVFIDDFSGIRDSEPDSGGKMLWKRIQDWPYFQLQSRLESCLQECGITVYYNKPANTSKICPKCGFKNEPAKLGVERLFICQNPGCRFTKNIDVVSAMNNLAIGKERIAKTLESSGQLIRDSSIESTKEDE